MWEICKGVSLCTARSWFFQSCCIISGLTGALWEDFCLPDVWVEKHVHTVRHTLTQIYTGSHTEVKLQSQKPPWLQLCLKSIFPFSFHFNLFSFQSLLSRLDRFHWFYWSCFYSGSLDRNKNTHQANWGSLEIVLWILTCINTRHHKLIGNEKCLNKFWTYNKIEWN